MAGKLASCCPAPPRPLISPLWMQDKTGDFSVMEPCMPLHAAFQYLAGTGSTGAAAAFAGLGALYFGVILACAALFRVPAPVPPYPSTCLLSLGLPSSPPPL